MDKLRKWMIKNYSIKVWEQYKTNVHKGGWHASLVEVAKVEYIDDLIHGFTWVKTEQGEKFWEAVCDCWRKENQLRTPGR